MYDEAIEVYDEEDDDEFDYSKKKRQGELSPVRKPKPPPPSSFNRRGTINYQDYRTSTAGGGFHNMEPLELSDDARPKTLSSKDFVTPRPGTSQRLGSSNSSNKTDNVLPDKRHNSDAIGLSRKMSDAQKGPSLDGDLPRKSSSKGRPMSAQRRGPTSDDEDDEDDYDEELNVAQIEGRYKRIIDNKRFLINGRGRDAYADGLSSSDSGSTSDGDEDFEDPLDRGQKTALKGPPSFKAFGSPIIPVPPFNDSIIFDNCFDIPPPKIAYHVPPLLDDEAMDEYIRHKKLWEIQMDMKREQIGQKVRETNLYPGVHDYNFPIYNPEDYVNLTVSAEIKEIFGYITQYVPPGLNSQQDVKLHPFIPDYYPSVGDIDAFIKVVDPEVKDDSLGIKCLDEPAPFQSDPSVLDLRLRALAKQSSAKAVVVKKVENVGKNSKIIENWIKDISDLHRSKPSPSVHYSKPMPDIDFLMQEWPPEMEELLKSINLPSPDLNCDLATYTDIVCSLVDIPVYKSRIQSLHVLFTLFTTLKQFGGAASGIQGIEADLMPSSTSLRLIDDVDHLQLS